MDAAAQLLAYIDEALVAHGGDLGGWTRQDGEQLQVFAGRVTLRADLRERGPTQRVGMVHAHVLATLHEYDDEVLDACIFGMGDTDEEALRQAAFVWLTCVAGPIRSFLDNHPVCMTCQAGVQEGDAEAGYLPQDLGLIGMRAFVGPALCRGFSTAGPAEASQSQHETVPNEPWFRYAAESAAPRRIHLAKATVLHDPAQGWRRELEIDGHDVSYVDPDWPGGPCKEFGYYTRFAVFEFPRNSNAMARRAELDRTILHFAQRYSSYQSIDALQTDMLRAGFDPDLVHDTESLATLAFGRCFFEPLGVKYPATIIRACRDGRIATDVPLMSLPAYGRGRALAPRLRELLSEEDFQSLCFYTAESNALLQAMDANPEHFDFADVRFMPPIVPERGASRETMDRALALLESTAAPARSVPEKRPWWKFWK